MSAPEPSPVPKPRRVRADELLALQGKAPSRAAAKTLIMAGKVRSGPDALVSKPATLLPADTPLTVEQPPRFVGRGGEKLEHALDHFGIAAADTHALDIGASTGGFTDCLLQRGAADAVCVDVGRAQLHARLRADPRVTNIERVNARELAAAALPRERFDIVVMDLSFISLTLVLAPAWKRVAAGGWLVALIKPQFECEKRVADKFRGVIRDGHEREKAVERVLAFVRENLTGAEIAGVTESPIRGGDGNIEFLLALRRPADAPATPH
ncbi:MAG: TlyA family RNA methyltransferase [Puniceicoccales bacterium]|jgi:23S rRNA (cytidine1920-2'-O)/16S rRNA (cytidine1409-2'-O)-methyltransferase|nr:TlyA family RNA methyltransferase [Puniceicoccales bacterium]